jgi:hypothetical protein
LSAMAKPTRQAPSVTKNAIFLARLVKRIAGLYQIILNEPQAKKNCCFAAGRRLFLGWREAINRAVFEVMSLPQPAHESLPRMAFMTKHF